MFYTISTILVVFYYFKYLRCILLFQLSQVYSTISTIAGVFYYFNSALNPILYSVMSKRFRRGLTDLKIKLIEKIFQFPPAHSIDGRGSKKEESPQERQRLVILHSIFIFTAGFDTKREINQNVFLHVFYSSKQKDLCFLFNKL